MSFRKIFAGASALALLSGGMVVSLAVMAPAAQAQAGNAKSIVDAAKARGEVGEQIDGYLGIPTGANPSAAVRAAVNEINIGRKTLYTRLSSERNVQVRQVARLSGEKQISTARGEMILGADGRWTKK